MGPSKASQSEATSMKFSTEKICFELRFIFFRQRKLNKHERCDKIVHSWFLDADINGWQGSISANWRTKAYEANLVSVTIATVSVEV